VLDGCQSSCPSGHSTTSHCAQANNAGKGSIVEQLMAYKPAAQRAAVVFVLGSAPYIGLVAGGKTIAGYNPIFRPQASLGDVRAHHERTHIGQSAIYISF
jgi:hypothetical protein